MNASRVLIGGLLVPLFTVAISGPGAWAKSYRPAHRHARSTPRHTARVRRTPAPAAPPKAPPPLTPPPVAPAQAASAVTGAKAALLKFAYARTFGDLSDVLTDATAFRLGREIVENEMYAVNYVAGSPLYAPDKTLLADFQAFVQAYGLDSTQALYGTPNANAATGAAPPGRRLLRGLMDLSRRLRASRITVSLNLPPDIHRMPTQIDLYRYTVYSPAWVDVDRLASGQAPLEARFEGGQWRIGARGDGTLNFNPTCHLFYGQMKDSSPFF